MIKKIKEEMYMTRSKSYRLRESQWDAYHKFEREQLKKEKRSFKEALAVLEGLWRFAKALGAFKGRDPLEGIEKDIRVARIVNSL